MAETDLHNELTKIKVELMRLLQSSVAILESVQGQNPTSWDQLKMMLKTAAESGDWNERIQNWVMAVKSSHAALGINTNFEYEVSAGFGGETVNGETFVDTNHITKKWIDVTTGQEVVATPNMQALDEAIQNEITQIVSKPDVLEAIFHLYTEVLMIIIPNLVRHIIRAEDNFFNEDLEIFAHSFFCTQQYQYWLASLLSCLLEAADLKTTWESFEEATDKDLNFLRGMSEKDQIEVTLERVQNVLRVVANDLTGNEETQESRLV